MPQHLRLTPRTFILTPDAGTTTYVRLGAAALVQVVSGAQVDIELTFQAPLVSRSNVEFGFSANRNNEVFSVHGEELWVVWPPAVDEAVDLMLRIWPFPSMHTGAPEEWKGLERWETLLYERVSIALSASTQIGSNQPAITEWPRKYSYCTLYLQSQPKWSSGELQLRILPPGGGAHVPVRLWALNRVLGGPDSQPTNAAAGTISFLIPPVEWSVWGVETGGTAVDVDMVMFQHQSPGAMDNRSIG